jgi:hypothetical protein
MALILLKTENSGDDQPLFGVIDLDEGVVPHLPQTYEFFDDDETIPSLEQKYQMDLSGFILKNTADVPGGLVEYHEPLE